MTTNRPLRTLILAFIISLMSVFSSGQPALAKEKISLLLDWFVNPDHGPIIIAQEKGYFEAQGLEVEITAPADPSNPPKLVAAGKADLAISYQPQLHLQTQEGLPLVRVGTLVATPLNCLLVIKDGPVQGLADLKGKKIGYSVPGFEEAFISTILEKVSLTPEDVELVNVNWSLSPSLISKQVDAVLGAFRNFELTQMELEGVQGKCFYLEEEGIPPYDELILIAHADILGDGGKAQRDKVRRFLTAIEQATHFMINHPDESWEIFRNTSKELQNELNRRAWIDTMPRFALRPSALDAGRYQRFESFLAAKQVVRKIRPVESMASDLFLLDQ